MTHMSRLLPVHPWTSSRWTQTKKVVYAESTMYVRTYICCSSFLMCFTGAGTPHRCSVP